MTASTPSSEKVLLDYDGPVAIISNNNPDKRNAFDDEMDLRLFEILAELSERSDIRAVIWRGTGHSFSTGRDVSAVGARFMCPELTHGVIPDTGGVGVLYEMCGHGVVSDLVLTGRAMSASEAVAHGVGSRVVPADQLDATVREMADDIAAKPRVTVNMARRIIRNLSEPQIRSSMSDELI